MKNTSLNFKKIVPRSLSITFVRNGYQWTVTVHKSRHDRPIYTINDQKMKYILSYNSAYDAMMALYKNYKDSDLIIFFKPLFNDAQVTKFLGECRER